MLDIFTGRKSVTVNLRLLPGRPGIWLPLLTLLRSSSPSVLVFLVVDRR